MNLLDFCHDQCLAHGHHVEGNNARQSTEKEEQW